MKELRAVIMLDLLEIIIPGDCSAKRAEQKGIFCSHVKMLKVSKGVGKPGFGPSVKNTLSKDYPIARPLFCYTLGEPKGELKKYLDWCLGAEGQKIVEDNGYVAKPKK